MQTFKVGIVIYDIFSHFLKKYCKWKGAITLQKYINQTVLMTDRQDENNEINH
jgi:hypothetical protein